MELKIGDQILIENTVYFITRETPCYFYAGNNYSIQKSKLNDYEDKVVVIENSWIGKKKDFATKPTKEQIRLSNIQKTKTILENINNEITSIKIEIGNVKDAYIDASEYFNITKKEAQQKIDEKINEFDAALVKLNSLIYNFSKKIED